MLCSVSTLREAQCQVPGQENKHDVIIVLDSWTIFRQEGWKKNEEFSMDVLFLILYKYKHTLFIIRAQSKKDNLPTIHKTNTLCRPVGSL